MATYKSHDTTSRARKRRPSLVQSVSRAAQIMQILLYSTPGRSLTQIADDLMLHKATVMRLVRTLEVEGLVRRNRATGGYELAVEFWLALAARSPGMLAAPGAAQMLIDELAQALGETVVVALANSARRAMLPVMWSVSEKTVHVDPRHLGPMPMHAVAAGKCYLASLSKEEFRLWAEDDLPRVTRHTITSVERLAREVAGVRELGYATARGEGIRNCGGLAVPIVDDAGQTLGGLQVVVLAENLTETNVRRWLPLLRAASSRLSPLLRIPARPRARPTPRRPLAASRGTEAKTTSQHSPGRRSAATTKG
jgi:DNA-binding IclR family transcriptional regulator